MRHVIGLSILSLTLASTTTVQAAEWFRMNMSPLVFFGSSTGGGGDNGDGESELPPDHGENSGERPVISASGGAFRALAPISIPVLVDTGSGGYVLEDDHTDLEVVAGDVDGQFVLEGALMSSATVRLTATDRLYIPSEPLDLQIDIVDMLAITGPSDLGIIRAGTPVSFDTTINGAIGSIDWTLSGAAALGIDQAGHVSGTPVAGTFSIVAHATDDFDHATAETSPIPLVVQPDLAIAMNNISASAGKAFAATPTVTGKIGSLSWELADGSTALPEGVTLDQVTGTISGQVEEETTGLRLAATDAFDGQEALSTAFAISVVADMVPDPFTIASLVGVEPQWEAISASVSPVGFDGAVPIVPATGTQVSVDGGPWASSSTISEGQSFRLKVTAPAQDQTLTTHVTVGSGAPSQWSVSTWTEIVRTISASTSAADPQALFGNTWNNPAIRKRLVVPGGVTVSSTTATTAALPINSALAGSLIIENRGVIAGAGGDGGVSGSVNGKDGGNAISLSVTGVKIINNGTIAGGGGGGGMGGKGANGYKTATVREPASGENYVLSSYEWHAFGGVATSTGIAISWNGGYNVAPSASASATSVTIGSYTYYRGAFKTTISTGSKYAVYRTSSQGQSVTGGTGGDGGKGGTYPGAGAAGSSGQASPGSGAGAGGKGGNGGAAGQTGGTGSTGATGTNGNPVAGYAGGAPGAAILGIPSADSVLGTAYQP